MEEPRIFILVDGEDQGAFTTGELAALWEAGEIGAGALYWHRGLTAWRSVATYRPPTPDEHTTPAHRIKLSTADVIAGEVIEEEIAIVTAEVVEGISMLAELSAVLTDVVGGRNERLEGLMARTHTACLTSLRDRARAERADAVTGIRLTPLPLSGKGTLFLAMSAVGTAVRLTARPPARP